MIEGLIGCRCAVEQVEITEGTEDDIGLGHGMVAAGGGFVRAPKFAAIVGVEADTPAGGFRPT